MRVTFITIEEFLHDLKNVESDKVFQQAVRIQRSQRPIQGDKYSAVKFEVVLQVSAVVSTDDGGEYIMETGEVCGYDYRDSSREFAGSEKADELKRMIEEFCSHHGLVVRPGLIEQ